MLNVEAVQKQALEDSEMLPDLEEKKEEAKSLQQILDESYDPKKTQNPEDSNAKYCGPPKVIFLVPFAMASAGKSYIWQKIQDQLKGQYDFKYVSSDETKHA